MKRIKKIVLLLFTLLLWITPAFAKVPVTYDRNTLENYGVKKKWKVTSENQANVMRSHAVDSEEKIYDFAGVLTDDEYNSLKKQIEEFIQKTNMDLVILIESFPYYQDRENEDYAVDFYDYNDFGMFNDNYSGTLLFRNTYESNPYYDMYNFGVAQQYFDQSRMDITLDGIYDNLHAGNYYEGFSSFIKYLSNFYDAGMALDDYELDENGFLQKKYEYPFIVIFGAAFVITAIIMGILISKNKMVRKATQAENYLDQSSVQITNRQDIFLTTHTTSYTVSSSSGGSSGGGGGHSSRGSSGGGHTSGGGRHG